MKNYIRNQHLKMRWDLANIPSDQLGVIVWEAWEAVLNDFIESLVNSWWNTYKAVIDAEDGLKDTE